MNTTTRKQILLALIVLVLGLVALVYVISQNPKNQSSFGTTDSVAVTGGISAINTDALAYDGPAIITLETLESEILTIEIPAQINLCPAADAIVSLNDLSIGDVVAVNGEVSDSGNIVVCANQNHYLRLSADPVAQQPSENTGSPSSGDTNPPAQPRLVTVSYQESKTIGQLTITPNAIIEDSRCPGNVNCIWAGQIIISVQLSSPNTPTQTYDMELGDSVTFGNYVIGFDDVRPYPNTESPIAPADYQFNFTIDQN